MIKIMSAFASLLAYNSRNFQMNNPEHETYDERKLKWFMTREYFEFLLTCPFEYLLSSSVSMDDFEFVLENADKDINTINFD